MKRVHCLWVAILAGAAVLPGRAPAKTLNLALDAPAPEILATDTAGKPVTLASLRGKPVVLQFGSLTEPVFRMRVPAVEKLAAKYGDKVAFIIIYERESHAADTADAIDVNATDGYAITKPVKLAERVALAQQAIDRLGIKNQRVLVDAWSDTSSLRYGGYPNMTFVIDADGRLRAGYPWMDPAKVKGAIDALLAGKLVPPEFIGHVQSGSPAITDYTDAAMDMGYRGPGSIAVVLDHLQISDGQKKAVYPAVADFIAEVRNFRELRGLGPNAAAQPAGAATQKAVSPEEFQQGVEKLRASAQHLKQVCTENLSPEDAKKIIDALDQGPAHRLFAD